MRLAGSRSGCCSPLQGEATVLAAQATRVELVPSMRHADIKVTSGLRAERQLS
jgi:hypothetical protein